MADLALSTGNQPGFLAPAKRGGAKDRTGKMQRYLTFVAVCFRARNFCESLLCREQHANLQVLVQGNFADEPID